MSKYLRRDKARQCPIHNAITHRAAEDLVEHGTFERSAVLAALNFAAIGDAIRWDYVREFIEEDYACELVPLVGRYFHRTKEEREKGWTPFTHPEKYIASGNGKRTAGYAAVGFSKDLDKLCICRLTQKDAVASGVNEALKRYMHEIHKRGLALPPELKILKP